MARGLPRGQRRLRVSLAAVKRWQAGSYRVRNDIDAYVHLSSSLLERDEAIDAHFSDDERAL